MLDLVITNGRIVDGTGNPWYYGEVGIKDGLITHVGRVDEERRETIDAGLQVIAPGFIDGHTHSDLLILDQPHGEFKLQQGVTTEIIGNCGLAPAPFLKGPRGADLRRYTGPVLGSTRREWNWSSIGQYIELLAASGPSENVATYVAHGALRIAVMGFANRSPTEAELLQMKELLEEGMKAGAIGLSIGLLYAPGSYAGLDELAELCRVLPRYGGLLSAHIRGEGSHLLESLREVILIAERSGVSLHISHLKAAGRGNWGQISQALELIEKARAGGLDTTCDVYPYSASSTMMSTLLPPWALEGGIDAALNRLREPQLRQRIAAELREEQRDWDNLVCSTGWSNVMVSSVSAQNRHLEGRRLLELAEAAGLPPEEYMLELLLQEEGRASIVYFLMSEEEVSQVVGYDKSLVISDSLGCITGKPHPRSFGTFPRLFRKYVREERLLSLEQAVRKITSFPAARFGLARRGLLASGYYGDVVIFDPAAISDEATYEDPIRYPKGISRVIVNGKPTMEAGNHTRVRQGQYLPHRACGPACRCSGHAPYGHASDAESGTTEV